MGRDSGLCIHCHHHFRDQLYDGYTVCLFIRASQSKDFPGHQEPGMRSFMLLDALTKNI